MKREFEPFSDRVGVPVIPSGSWQRALSALLFGVGLFAFAAAVSGPAEGAGMVASICLALSSGLLFWGVMLRYLSALEEKLGLLIVGLESTGIDDDEQ